MPKGFGKDRSGLSDDLSYKYEPQKGSDWCDMSYAWEDIESTFPGYTSATNIAGTCNVGGWDDNPEMEIREFDCGFAC